MTRRLTGIAVPASKRERNKLANREAILEAARKCFLKQGYDAVTVRDVIRITGLAAGTFYNYFPDKDALFRAVLEARMNELNTAYTACVTTDAVLELWQRRGALSGVNLSTAFARLGRHRGHDELASTGTLLEW